MIYVLEVTAGIDSGGTTQKFLFGTVGFTTTGADTPADTVVYDKLHQPANIARRLASNRALFGVLDTSEGVCVVTNTGAFDAFSRYGFGWRPCVLRMCDPAYGAFPAYPSGWTTVFVGSIKEVVRERGRIVFTMQDNLAKLDKFMNSRYLGTGNAEGTAQMVGMAKPRQYGQTCNVTPVLVDPTNRIYQVSDKPYTVARNVYDKRVNYAHMSTNYNDVASFAALQGLAVPANQVGWWSDGSMFKLGNAPNGKITVDVVRQEVTYAAASGRSRLGELISDIGTDAGLSVGTDIDSTTAAIESGGGANHGFYSTSLETTYRMALAAVCASRGAWIGCDRNGVLKGAILVAPTGTPAWTFTRSNTTAMDMVQSWLKVPASSVQVQGGRNWTPMLEAEIDATVSADNKRLLGLQFLYTENSAGSLAAKYLNAQTYTHETYSGQVNVVTPALPGNSVGVTASSLRDLFAVERDTVEVTCGLSIPLITAVDFGSVVTLLYPRFGYDAGKLFLVIGVRYNLASNTVTFTLWG